MGVKKSWIWRFYGISTNRQSNGVDQNNVSSSDELTRTGFAPKSKSVAPFAKSTVARRGNKSLERRRRDRHLAVEEFKGSNVEIIAHLHGNWTFHFYQSEQKNWNWPRPDLSFVHRRRQINGVWDRRSGHQLLNRHWPLDWVTTHVSQINIGRNTTSDNAFSAFDAHSHLVISMQDDRIT